MDVNEVSNFRGQFKFIGILRNQQDWKVFDEKWRLAELIKRLVNDFDLHDVIALLLSVQWLGDVHYTTDCTG